MKSTLCLMLACVTHLSCPFLRADCFPVPSGAIGWWRAENNANDSIGTNHGTLFNGAGFGAGKAGQAFQIDGADDEVQIPNSADFAFSNGLTIEGWMSTSNSPDFAGLVTKFVNGPPYSGFEVSLSGGNGFPPNQGGILRADFGVGAGYVVAFNTRYVEDGLLHHFALTCDGNQAILYVDAVPGDPISVANWQRTNSFPLFFGVDPTCSCRHFHGFLDEITLYDRALTGTEILAIFNASSSAKCLRSVDWFKIAGGGGIATGVAGRVLRGTIGQADAGGPLTNTQFSLLGGFWALPVAVQTTGAPTLTIVAAGPGQATISWTPNTPGFVLQETTSLSSPAWGNSASGSTNPVTVPATVPAKLYRLTKP